MLKNTELLFKLINDLLFDKGFTDFDELKSCDFNQVFLCAKKHDITNLLAFELDKLNFSLDKETDKKLSDEKQLCILRYSKREYVKEMVVNALCKNKLRHVLLKGAVIKNYYAKPYYRQSCDIDILVKKEDVSVISNILTENLGFTFKAKGPHDCAFVSPENIVLELHYGLCDLGEDEEIKEKLNGVWDNAFATDNEYGLTLSDEFFYLYLVFHIAKHIRNGGCGIKMLLDLYICNQKFNFNDEKKKEILEKFSLYELDKSCLSLCRCWFEGKEKDELDGLLEEFVISGGAYGTDINNNKINLTKSSKKGLLWGRIWVSRNALKNYFGKTDIPFLLIPFYQIKRWFMTIKNKRIKKSVRNVKNAGNISKEDIIKTKKLVDGLGIERYIG